MERKQIDPPLYAEPSAPKPKGGKFDGYTTYNPTNGYSQNLFKRTIDMDGGDEIPTVIVPEFDTVPGGSGLIAVKIGEHVYRDPNDSDNKEDTNTQVKPGISSGLEYTPFKSVSK